MLPFADMSPLRDQAYFCEGIAEEILNALSQLGLVLFMFLVGLELNVGELRRQGRAIRLFRPPAVLTVQGHCRNVGTDLEPMLVQTPAIH